MEEINNALEMLKGCDITLMYGFQAEPTELEDNNLNRIGTLKKHIINRSVSRITLPAIPIWHYISRLLRWGLA